MFTVPFTGWFVYLWQRKQLRDTLSGINQCCFVKNKYNGFNASETSVYAKKIIIRPSSLLVLHRAMFSFCFHWRSRAERRHFRLRFTIKFLQVKLQKEKNPLQVL